MGPDQYIGSISIFGGTFAPKNYMYCMGQVVGIDDYWNLYNVLGTAYGGDGRMSFGIPDFRGRMVLGQGTGVALHPRDRGQMGGFEETRLEVEQLPQHTHEARLATRDLKTEVKVSAELKDSKVKGEIKAYSGHGSQNSPVGNVPAMGKDGDDAWGTIWDGQLYSEAFENGRVEELDLELKAEVTMEDGVDVRVDWTGDNNYIDNMPPFTVAPFMICAEGIFPPRP